MKSLLRSYVISLASLYLTSLFISGLTYQGGYKTLLFGSAVLMIINWFIKPVAKIFMIPFNLITLGLFSWLVNVLMFFLLTKLVPQIQISAWNFPGLTFAGYALPGMPLNQLMTLIAVSFSVAFIGSLLHWFCK